MHLLVMLTTIALLVACGKSENVSKPGTGSDNKEPIELVFASHLGMYPEDFERDIGNPIRQKFPHITPKYIERGNGTNLPDLVAAGTPPDITWFVHGNFVGSIQALGLDYDMTDLVKKYNYDMNRYYSQALETLQYYTNGKGIYGIPKEISQYVLYYNKDLFDKFGVAYPKDGMTWDDAYEMARKMTRLVDGVQYRGMSTFYTILFRENQLSLSPLSRTEDKADVNNDGWKTLLTTFDKIYKIPGNNRPTNTRSITPEVEQFEKELNVASIAVGYGRHVNFPPQLNWDIVTLPTFKEKPKTTAQSSPTFWAVTSASKHKDEAFQVIMYLMSDERMIQTSKQGLLTPVNLPEVQKAFATDAPALKGKNLQALFINQYASIEPPRAPGLLNTVRQDAINIVSDAFTDMLLKDIDVNTALRQAEEKINQKISEVKSK
jgi:multiple sugar transport system substrate-binding protein